MLQDSGTAPYAPAEAVIKVLDAYRDTGLTITPTNIERLGVGESIVGRTIGALKTLDFLDEGGEPTQALKDFKTASHDQYRQVLAESLRAAYAPIFAITGTDPSAAPPERLEDAFRKHTPDSLRPRMVRLFLGLCEYAGIIEEAPVKKPGPRTGRRTNGGPKPKVKDLPPPPPPPLLPPPPAANGQTNTVTLRSGGEVTLSVSVNLFDLSNEDREFVLGLVDKVKGYAARRELTAGPPAIAEVSAS